MSRLGAETQRATAAASEAIAEIGAGIGAGMRSLPLLATQLLPDEEAARADEQPTPPHPLQSEDTCSEDLSPATVHSPPVTSAPYPSISGHLWKRGRRTGAWKRGSYCISNASFCELQEHGVAPAAPEISIIPVAIDTQSRASVRRAVPLVDVVSCVSCEELAAQQRKSVDGTGRGSIGSGSGSDDGGGGFLWRMFGIPEVPEGDLGRTFKLATTTRTFTFRAEQPKEALEWVHGFQLVADANSGRRTDVGPDVLRVVVEDDDERGPPLRINLRFAEDRVRTLKERLVERRGLLPSQQILTTHRGGVRLLDDDALLAEIAASEAGLPSYVPEGGGAAVSTAGWGGEGDGGVCGRQSGLRLRLRQRPLLKGAPCAGPDPLTGHGLRSHADVVAIEQPHPAAYNAGAAREPEDPKWRFKLDWEPPARCDALVLYHKRFPPDRNLLKLLTGNAQHGPAAGAAAAAAGSTTAAAGTTLGGGEARPESDAWWREHLTMVHVTPQPIKGEAHLTLVLEGTSDSLGIATDRHRDIYERPLLIFCPKGPMQRFTLEPALRLGFGPMGEGYTTSTDRFGREIWVIRRPPLVTEELVAPEPGAPPFKHGAQPMRVLFTYLFRNPGSVTVMPVLQACRRFRIVFQPVAADVYAKFEVQPRVLDMLS